ncbi:MAG: hypothetical protein ACP5MZ_02610 [Candidatus Micrarchaeia archaeon]
MGNDALAYAFLSAYSIGIIISALTLNAYAIVISLALLTIGTLLFKGWDIFLPIAVKHTGIIRLIGSYEVSGNQNAAVRQTKRGFSAVAYAVIDISDSEGLSRDKLEGIIARINVPFKLVLSVERLNMDKILDSLKTARHMKENQITRLSGGSERNIQKINSVKRELEQIDNDIRSMTSGRMPLHALYYLSVEAESGNRYAAESAAVSGLDEVSGTISASTGYKVKAISGNELVYFLGTGSNMVA